MMLEESIKAWTNHVSLYPLLAEYTMWCCYEVRCILVIGEPCIQIDGLQHQQPEANKAEARRAAITAMRNVLECGSAKLA